MPRCVEQDPRLGGRADLYLEGSDQHRGWFHTALLTSLATRDRAPYESVLTHGFTLDGKGRKMSKSLGNTIAPQDIAKKSGAEILRLWVSAEDYREDVRISDEILNRLVEAYRRVRNTARFLISNLYDFDPTADRVAREELDELDRWILGRTENLLARCREAYDNYEFHVVYHSLNNFCSVDLSAQYLDIVKDRLYCEGAKSIQRRAAQTTIYRILDVLAHLIAPILSFTAEEIWNYMPDKAKRPKSVFLSQIPEPDLTIVDTALAEKWDRILRERSEVLKALEQARTAGIIGHSLDAQVVFENRNGDHGSILRKLIHADRNRLQDLLIVSQASETVEVGGGTGEESSYDAPLLNCWLRCAKPKAANASAVGSMILKSAPIRIIRRFARAALRCSTAERRFERQVEVCQRLARRYCHPRSVDQVHRRSVDASASLHSYHRRLFQPDLCA